MDNPTIVDPSDHTGHHTVEHQHTETDANGVPKIMFVNWCIDEDVLIEYEIRKAD